MQLRIKLKRKDGKRGFDVPEEVKEVSNRGNSHGFAGQESER